MARGKTVVTDKGEKRIRAQLKLLDKSFTSIGVHEGAGKYTTGKNPPSVAEVAFWNEFGTKTAPERAAIRSGIEEKRKSINELVNQQLNSVVRGSQTVKGGLDVIGFAGQTAIQNRITTAGSWAVPNAPSTVAKKSKGGALRGATPLIESGLYLRSITNKTKLVRK